MTPNECIELIEYLRDSCHGQNAEYYDEGHGCYFTIKSYPVTAVEEAIEHFVSNAAYEVDWEQEYKDKVCECEDKDHIIEDLKKELQKLNEAFEHNQHTLHVIETLLGRKFNDFV